MQRGGDALNDNSSATSEHTKPRPQVALPELTSTGRSLVGVVEPLPSTAQYSTGGRNSMKCCFPQCPQKTGALGKGQEMRADPKGPL